ncbi:MAG: Gfo/Idh/MocA family oxidoreductase [Chloroflexota bacterium]|jgi:predicted dehydrogenase|nr:Gfo/Idh/MocA family oxidoreductase [Chloroflexota bacterium]
MSEVGFTTMAGPAATGDAPTLGVGMLGYAFMGKAHANALKKLPYMMYPPVAIPHLAAIAGRNENAVKEAAKRYGFAKAYTDWRQLIDDPAVQVFDNAGPNNLHTEPNIAAAKAGKHVFSEKPLGRNAAECMEMWNAVKSAGVKHQVAFNYRFVPAVRLVKNLIDSGKLGRIYHFRAAYLQEWIADVNFPMVWRLYGDVAGSGALGDLGSHVIDLARYLVGEPKSLMANVQTFIKERKDENGKLQPVTVDDAFQSMLEFENGAAGTIEASRFCLGRKNHNSFEINAEHGSVRFCLEQMNELEVHWRKGDEATQGFTKVLVTESHHPFWSNWWPHGHIIGWEHTFVHEFAHFFDAIVNNKSVRPHAADFEDGYRNAVICDAIIKSAGTRRQVDIEY